MCSVHVGREEHSVLGVIPARFASSRMPGKPLALINDVPMVEWVARGASESERMDELIIATDDERVRDAVESCGRHAVMTSPTLQTGTDRVAIVAARFDYDLVINIQGDEPLIKGPMIDALAEALASDDSVPMATLGHPISEEEATDPNAVKVVTDMRGRALYFSRAKIPFIRRTPHEGAQNYFKHVGIYGYRRDFLLKFAALPPSPLERAEGLEQLRALEYGFPIRVVETPYRVVGVDIHEDLERVREELDR
ncbi:MAG: 3-deoxy-manno-octulosonate cytidylyltransferase [Candidatus Latescibacteria bacterium]|nr:3-deoxy-manno-octulosonate cytidylyltransferase [Candidatus Latescibacterota bacterium]